MEDIKKGDVLWGTKKKFEEAWHPIVYISGPVEAPLAVILTSEKDIHCNIPLLNTYRKNKPSYFVAHLIEKMSEWGPYKKFTTLKREDLELIEKHIAGQNSITWSEYEKYTKGGCPDHKCNDAREGSL